LLLPALRRASGTVVLINSGAGQRANPGWSAYSASKFALRSFADALRHEVRGDRMRVTSIHPGRVDTDMQHELRAAEQGEYEPENYLRPESVASAVRFALTVPDEAAVDEMTFRPR
jgi:NADP-dependent 3-hydroxy acid dehydrogenase YdfG